MRYLKKNLFILGVLMVAGVLFACSSKGNVNIATVEETNNNETLDTKKSEEEKPELGDQKQEESNEEKTKEQTVDEGEKEDTVEENTSLDASSEKISQEQALEILNKAMEGEIIEGESIRYDHDQTINDMVYYVFQYYNSTETIAWFYVNQIDRSILKWDLSDDEPVAFVPGETKFVH